MGGSGASRSPGGSERRSWQAVEPKAPWAPRVPASVAGPHEAQAIPRTVPPRRNAIIRTQLPGPAAEEDVYFEIQTEPPTRDQLFSLGSEDQFLKELEMNFKSKDPNQVFLMPGPIDRFEGPDNPTLGPNWFQNRISGLGRDKINETKGDMSTQGNRGMQAVGMPPEAAIISESIGSDDMVASVNIALGSPQSKFGLIFRARDPNSWIDAVDQIQANSFYYAVATAGEITLGRMVEGQDTVIQKAPIEPKSTFNLAVLAFGDDIVVFRDDAEVLRAHDNSLRLLDEKLAAKEAKKSKRMSRAYVGVLGLIAAGKATTFDDFIGLRYGGPYLERQFAESVGVLQAPSVYYHPLYFEQMGLERFGQSCGNLVQPTVAHTMFFVHLVGLPYSMGKSSVCEYHSGECYPKPGDIVLPYRIATPVWDVKGVSQEVAFWALAFALLP